MAKTSARDGTGKAAVRLARRSAFLCLVSGMLAAAGASYAATGSGASTAAPSTGQAPDSGWLRPRHPALPFIPNRGQLDRQLRYYAYTDTGIVYVTDTGDIVYALLSGNRHAPQTPAKIVRERIVNARVTAVEASQRAATTVNIFSGNQSKQWLRDLPTYQTVSLGSVYPGIEVLLHASDHRVEKRFVVRPGADPDRIRIALAGEKPVVNRDGELEVASLQGAVRFSRPVAFQQVDGARKFVDVAYTRTPEGYGFVTGKYDRSRTLVIDPVLAASYVGGSDQDSGYALALNSQGQAYIAGIAQSADLPGIVPGTSADSTFDGQSEAFVARLDPDLTSILSATFLGGTSTFNDIGRGLAIDAADNVYVVGTTDSSDFPGVSAGSADSTFAGNSEGFVVKLTPDLATIQASTFYGGSSDDDVLAVAIGNGGDVIVGGSTNSSPDLPGVTAGSADPTVALTEGFVARFDANLSTVMNATYLGGSNANERVEGVAVDAVGNVYATGVTGSDDFPGVTAASADSTFGPMFDLEAFVAKLDASLSTLLAASYAGGDGQDSASAIALAGGDVYIAGRTSSDNFPGITATSADSTLVGSEDAFVARFNTTLTAIGAATYLGGSGNGDVILAIVPDTAGNLYVAGETTSTDFPGVGATSADSDPGGGAEAFVARLNGNLDNLLAATYLGGNEGGEFAFGLALDAYGNVYVGGLTGSADFPGIDAESADSVFSDREAFVAKLDPDLSEYPPDCSQATPGIQRLWPPSHQLIPVGITGVTDPEGTPVTINIDSVAQDEAVTDSGSGATCPDAQGIDTSTAHLRAERSGPGDGRVYHVAFTATDGAGKQCSGMVAVCVPHSEGAACVDGGPVYDSTVCP
jgi:Beta-propeller repeat